MLPAGWTSRGTFAVDEAELWVVFMHAAMTGTQVEIHSRGFLGAEPIHVDASTAAAFADKALEEYKKRWGDGSREVAGGE